MLSNYSFFKEEILAVYMLNKAAQTNILMRSLFGVVLASSSPD